jgi:hypothetical protein
LGSLGSCCRRWRCRLQQQQLYRLPRHLKLQLLALLLLLGLPQAAVRLLQGRLSLLFLLLLQEQG